jgi:hypothetical protein
MFIKVSMKIVEIPITLQAIRIDGKKLTASTLDQFPLSTLMEYIQKNELWDFNFDEYDIEYICRFHALPFFKRHRTNLLSLYKRYDVDRMLEKYKFVDELGLWSIEGEVFLYPINRYLTTEYDASWNDIISEFHSSFSATPKVFLGV